MFFEDPANLSIRCIDPGFSQLLDGMFARKPFDIKQAVQATELEVERNAKLENVQYNPEENPEDVVIQAFLKIKNMKMDAPWVAFIDRCCLPEYSQKPGVLNAAIKACESLKSVFSMVNRLEKVREAIEETFPRS